MADVYVTLKQVLKQSAELERSYSRLREAEIWHTHCLYELEAASKSASVGSAEMRVLERALAWASNKLAKRMLAHEEIMKVSRATGIGV